MNTNDVIRDFIQNNIVQHNLDKPLDDNDQLVESGIVDSLGIMSLLSFLEEKFSMQIPSEDLNPENFASVAMITALVERQRPG
ncbi:MAG TPA: acyl carrier protein [Anaerolineales bacterium]|nr:acyl carrier protein [Anaerolineales bacterium]